MRRLIFNRERQAGYVLVVYLVLAVVCVLVGTGIIPATPNWPFR